MGESYYQQAAVSIEYQPLYLCERTDFLTGNIIKYLCRADYKGQKLSDLAKAYTYAQEAIRLNFADEFSAYYPLYHGLSQPPHVDVVECFIFKFPPLGLFLEQRTDGLEPLDYIVSKSGLEALSSRLREQVQELDKAGKYRYVYAS